MHAVKGFGIVNKAEIDVFLELSCFFRYLVDVDNLISDSSAFSKTSLTIWKFTVFILLKPGLRNLYAVQEATVRTGYGTTDWFKIGKGVHQGCILSPCLFNFYAEYIMRSTGLEEAQAGIKITGRNINNLRYADDTTLMAESEDELKAS